MSWDAGGVPAVGTRAGLLSDAVRVRECPEDLGLPYGGSKAMHID